MIKFTFSILVFSFFIANISFSQTKEDARFYELFSESQRFLLLEESDTAKILLQKCLELRPNSATVNYALARIYSFENEKGLAIFYAQEAVKFNENNIWFLRFLAGLYADSYAYNDADKIYQKIINKSTYISDFLLVSEFYDNYHEYNKELEIANIIIEKFGNTFNNLKRKVNVCFLLNNTDCVIENCKKIIDIYPNNPNSYILFIDYLMEFNKFDTAYQYIKLATNIFPENSSFDYYSAIYFSKIQNVDSSFLYLSRVIKSRKYTGSDIINLLTGDDDFYNYQMFDSKMDSIITALNFNYSNNSDVTNFIARFYFDNNRFYDAIYFYELSLSENISDFDLYISLFNLYNRFNYWDKLDSLAISAEELFPAQPLIYLFKGIANLEKSNYDEAYEAFVLGNSLVYDQPELTAFFSFYLSQYFRISNVLSNENLYYNNAVAAASNNCDLLAYFAFYFAKNSICKEKSLNLIGRCIIADVEKLSPYIAFIYSYVLYKFNDYESALNYINIAIANSKYENFTHFELLGNIQFKLNNDVQANNSWLKSVKLGNKYLNKQL